MVFGSAAAAILQLRHLGVAGIQAQQDVQAVRTELRHQDSLEWRAISGRVTPDQVRAELAGSRATAADLISQVGRTGLGRAELAAARERIDAYAVAVDTELSLLRAGDTAAAQEYDEATVDPAFDEAMTALAGYADMVAAAAVRAGTESDLGLLLTVALSVGLTTVVQGRRRWQAVRRRAVQASDARHRALVEQSADLVLVVDPQGTTHYVSPSVDRLLGGTGTGARPGYAALLDALPATDRDSLSSLLATVTPGRTARLEVRLRAGQGWRTVDLSVRNLTADPAVAGIVLTGHDISERQELQQELEHRALHDSLTGLPNRALFADRFDQALRGTARDGRQTGLLLIDLDKFKEVNDTLGHHYGDELLVQVGERLRGILRDGDTVARLGGDEFAVLLPGVGGEPAALEVAGKVQKSLAGPFRVDGLDLSVEASIGVVMSGVHGNDPGTLLRRADIAMYVAKQRNLPVFAYDPGADQHSPQRLSLLADLRRALADGALFLQYQPKVRLSDGQLCGVEALARWQHPELGLVPPDEFIPLAENSGLVGPLTAYVLDLALAQARRWLDAGQPLPMAVNLSARNLIDEDLANRVMLALDKHGVPARLLTLEITESAIMTDPERARRVLDRLAGCGVLLSIDDFGAGYTSLSQLKDLPITELKVDRSFVAALRSDTGSGLIVRSVLELGRDLGLSTVAEGVESAEILTDVTTYQCDVAQGYHLSRPLSEEALDRWRAAWQARSGQAWPAADPP